MKIKSLLLIMLSVCLTVCLCACGDDTTPADNNNTTTTQNGGNSSAITTTTTQARTTTTTAAAGKVTYTVTVTDEAGNPVPGVRVQLCLESCLPTVTSAQGVATWQNMDEADYKISFWDALPEGYSSDATEFHFADGSYELTIVLKTVA